MSMDELAEKEAGIEAFFSDIEKRINEKRENWRTQINLSIEAENEKKKISMMAEYNQ